MIFIIYLISINLLGFFLTITDKLLAILHKFRIPEILLLTIALLGGCFGVFIGMQLSHHKTKKPKFKLVYLFIIIWSILIYKIYPFL